MGNSIKKSFEALKTIGSLDDLNLEESAWSFMALDSIFGMLENRESRGDHRVNIAGNTGLPRKNLHPFNLKDFKIKFENSDFV